MQRHPLPPHRHIHRHLSDGCDTTVVNHALQISPDGTTLYAAGYAAVPPSTGTEAELDNHGVQGADAAAAGAAVWRYEMKPREIRALARLGSRMEAFQGAFVGCQCFLLVFTVFSV